METKESSRRRFLVNAGKTTVVAAATGIVASSALAAGTKPVGQTVKGKSKKVEILYQKTATWDNYYKRAF